MSVLGIDVGSSVTVMATVNKGAVSVVRNELADRTTPSLVSFTNSGRLCGDQSLAQLKSNYKNTCRYFKNLLGECYDDDYVKKEIKYGFDNVVRIDEASGKCGFDVSYKSKMTVFTPEQIFASFLTKLKAIAEKNLQKSSPLEIVIACPSWFTHIHRQALYDAVDISGLKSLKIISDMSAILLDYGLFRRKDFSPRPYYVAFVGIGHSSSSVAIASFTDKEATMLTEKSDRFFGGRDIDYLISEFMIKEFEKKYNIDISNNKKAWIKIEEQSSRCKKILSANSEAQFNIECLVDEHDLAYTFSRQFFEELCLAAFEKRLNQLMQSAVDTCGLHPSNLKTVEIVGGSTRIPWVQKLISKFFSLECSRTLDADETVARGCALQAAMASNYFKVREYGYVERLNYAMEIRWENNEKEPKESAFSQDNANTNNTNSNEIVVGKQDHIDIPIGTPTSTLHKITFIRKHSFKLLVQYKDMLPGENTIKQICSCDIDIPSTDEEKEIQVFWCITYNGLFKITRVMTKERSCQKKEKKSREGEDEDMDFQSAKNSVPSSSSAEHSNEALSSEPTGDQKAKNEIDNEKSIDSQTTINTETLDSDESSMNVDNKTSTKNVDDVSSFFSTENKGNKNSVDDTKKEQEDASTNDSDKKKSEENVEMTSSSEDTTASKAEANEKNKLEEKGNKQNVDVKNDQNTNEKKSSKDTKVVKKDVDFHVVYYKEKLPSEKKKEFFDLEINMENDDRVENEKLEKLNELESSLYNLREDLDGKYIPYLNEGEWNDAFNKYIDLDERPDDESVEKKSNNLGQDKINLLALKGYKNKIKKDLDILSNWLDENQFDNSLRKKDVVRRLNVLNTLEKPLVERYALQQQFEEAVSSFISILEEGKVFAQSNDQRYMLVPAERRDYIILRAYDLNIWINQMVEEQKKSPLYEPLVITPQEIEEHKNEFIEYAKALMNTTDNIRIYPRGAVQRKNVTSEAPKKSQNEKINIENMNDIKKHGEEEKKNNQDKKAKNEDKQGNSVELNNSTDDGKCKGEPGKMTISDDNKENNYNDNEDKNAKTNEHKTQDVAME